MSTYVPSEQFRRPPAGKSAGRRPGGCSWRTSCRLFNSIQWRYRGARHEYRCHDFPTSKCAEQAKRINEPERDVLASRLAYLTVGLPTAGTVGAIAYAFYDGLMVSDVVLFVVMYLITALGVEAGLHRYFTHRSFEASEPVKVFLGVAGSMAAQGPVIFWVANHRLHHAFADTDRDPHSPQPQGPGIRGRAKGLWHGHVGWLFDVKKIDWSRHTRDWLADRRVMKINAHYFSLVLLGIAAARCHRRSCDAIRARLGRGHPLGRIRPYLRTRPCDVGGELTRAHDRQPRIPAP